MFVSMEYYIIIIVNIVLGEAVCLRKQPQCLLLIVSSLSPVICECSAVYVTFFKR